MATGGPCAFSGERIHRFHQICKVVPGTPPSEKSLHLVSAYLGQALFKGLALNDAA